MVRRPYVYWYDNELDAVERGLMNLAAAKVELIGDLESVDDVSGFTNTGVVNVSVYCMVVMHLTVMLHACEM